MNHVPSSQSGAEIASRSLLVRDLGRVTYADGLALQRRLQAEVIAARAATNPGPMHLLLLEHDPPVITVSRRQGARANLIAGPGELAAAGVEVAETDRGGDITYHGPGQLVVYPILDLNRLGLRLHSYMRGLEQIVIDVLGELGIEGVHSPGATGVWVPGSGDAPPTRKICAMGVRVSRWVSMHGLALNVATNLAHFDLIVPCGLSGCVVTSVERETGVAADLGDVKQRMSAAFHRFVAAPEGTERRDTGAQTGS
ncbi:MAG: lipoyl(octanoyl) transferase LipB [Phycisphaerales bacterium]|nr:lipoyl(octanoyl) transferase LipB [Phycisphaerae bacterium]NNF44832.1 lipoyl(octanoyl) transferase LipB [Phycisphaerales bacterium]NNM24803.1 lipoyl(octanoyl) transferase LipB [Phycisphaerales bacterium]